MIQGKKDFDFAERNNESDQEVNKMPGFDRTGPRGMGLMTGGGRGFCTGLANRQWMPGRGGFFGRGAGHGWRNCYYATGLPRWQRWTSCNTPASAEDEKQALKSEADFLRTRLNALEERLAAMQAEDK
jgi:Family of unknown function (DUF5320)